MYTLSRWEKMPSGNVKVEVVLDTLKRVTMIVHPKEANDQTVRMMVDNLMKNPKFNGSLK